jgi:RNA polymerase sigma-70 factor (ECF subfamily)
MVGGMSIAGSAKQSTTEPVADMLARLFQESAAERFGFACAQFEELILEIAESNRWGCDVDVPTDARKREFLATIGVKELVLARACALGNERAWEVFLMQYREILYSAAYGITKQDAGGRELADSLYAELFGVSAREGQRQSKLASYTGRGSLACWLRSVLAQRYVDEYRKARRLVSIEDQDAELLTVMPETPSIDSGLHRNALAESIGVVLSELAAEDRFLLNAYHLDGRSLADIARLLGVHESTISRRLKRLGKSLRKQLLHHLQSSGLSRRAAEEALGGDVRDIDVNVRTCLQVAGEESFHKLKGAEVQTASMFSTGEES